MGTKRVLQTGVSLQLAFAVAVYDSYAERQLTGSRVRIQLPEDPLNRPIVKNDGYYVILQRHEKITKIQVHAPGFFSQELSVDRDLLEQTDGILYVRMMPDATYQGIRRPFLLRHSDVKPGETVSVIPLDMKKSRKLNADASAGSTEIQIFRRGSESLEGRTYALMRNSSREGMEEVFLLLEAENAGTYHLQKPLLSEWKRTEAVLYPLHRVKADENGNLYLPLSCEKQEESVKCILKQENGFIQTVLLDPEESVKKEK